MIRTVIPAILFLITSNLVFAEDSLTTGITVLDQNTFVKTDSTIEGTNVIQLFKVKDEEIFLVDAIQIDERKVNFRTLLEFRKLKIERKD